MITENPERIVTTANARTKIVAISQLYKEKPGPDFHYLFSPLSIVGPNSQGFNDPILLLQGWELLGYLDLIRKSWMASEC